MATTPHSAAFGAVMGACVGDALGAYFEFEPEISPEMLEAALTMPGGGTHGVGVGQVTDDSEMAICMMRGLIGGQGLFNVDSIAHYYWLWYLSEPFGLGRTCSIAFKDFTKSSCPLSCLRRAKHFNRESQSNGSLMRITPLGVWCRNLSNAEAAKAARIEGSLTHSHPVILHAGACYVLALKHLINHFGDREGAYQVAKKYAFTEGNCDIQDWFRSIENEPPFVPPYNQIGWAKVGFTRAFHCLRAGDTYEDAIRKTIEIGGDSDTNGAIVGGLVGAAVGFEGIPGRYAGKVMMYCFEKEGGIQRPDFLNQNLVLQLAEQVFTIAPASLTTQISTLSPAFHDPLNLPPSKSAAFGAVLGAFIGDALGAYIEFQNDISPPLLQETLTMPGGGPFHLGQGQVTDDSELAMCMIRGLLAGKGKLDMDAIAGYYRSWMETSPFDIGTTTRQALEPLMEGNDTADVCIASAESSNGTSQSNGSLMRLTPLAVWAHRLSPAQIAKAARIEASMTHSNPTIQHANACYVLAISHLIRDPGNKSEAFGAAKHYADTEGNDDIKEWFQVVSSGHKMPGSPQMGWAKIAFTHAFRHLMWGIGYEEAIGETLALGGDTDTNAAIVGGLVGAARGVEDLPGGYVEKVLGYTYETQKGRKRPDFLNQTEVLQQLEQLYAMAPTTATVVIGGVEQEL